MIKPHELVIGDHNWQEHVDVTVDGEQKGRGLVPRNYATHPVGSLQGVRAFDMPLIPRSEWVERIREMEASKSRLSDIRRMMGPNGGHIPSLDQDGIGYCWNHSATMILMLLRAKMGLPYKKLSAFFVGCIIKSYRDEGGWGAQALEFIAQNGVPTVEFWPEKSMDRKNDNAATRANALEHKVTEAWVDMQAAAYDRNLSEDQAMTCLLSRDPVIGDFNWWGHSVCLLDPVLVSETPSLILTDFASLDLNSPRDLAVYEAAFGKRGLNSWTDAYGDLGEFVLQGSRAILNGGAAGRAATASMN